MSTDQQLATKLIDKGYRLTDALRLQPSDVIEGVLAMKRRSQHRVLVLDHMTAREADVILTEARDAGWSPVRWLRLGPEKPITARLGLARGAI